MNKPVLTEKITEQIRKAQHNEIMHQVIYLNSIPSAAQHEFLFFIKPEITLEDNHIRLDAILNLMFTKMEEFKFEIREIRILGASYLEQYNIIAQHYGVINAISRNASGNLTPEGAGKFKSTFGIMPQDARILGALEFLEIYKDYDPFSLEELWQNSQTVKLAGGTYCARLTLENETVFLLNGFHPRQLVNFTEPGRSIVTFSLASDIDWSVARNQFIGKTNPADAAEGSLRNELLKNKSSFGLETVNPSRNGFHLSAGPVEGLVELMRYCSDYSAGTMKTYDDFEFGRKLHAAFSSMEVTKICANNYVEFGGNKTSTFDLTEEKNAEQALRLLKESRIS